MLCVISGWTITNPTNSNQRTQIMYLYKNLNTGNWYVVDRKTMACLMRHKKSMTSMGVTSSIKLYYI